MARGGGAGAGSAGPRHFRRPGPPCPRRAPGPGGELLARGPGMRSPGVAAQRSAQDGAGPRGSCTHAIPGRGVPWEQHTSLQDVGPDGCPSRRGIPVWPRSFCNLERVAFSIGTPERRDSPGWPPRCCELGGFPRCLLGLLNLLRLKDGTGSCFGRYMPRRK